MKPKTITAYIQAAPKPAQAPLRALRGILKKAAPKATEAIKWGSPVFEAERILFAFAAFKTHINFMPTHASLQPFKKELVAYKTGKDTLQLPYDKRLPKVLIQKIARHRVKAVQSGAKWMSR